MLAWVVIDRTHSRQFLPKSSSLRTLRLCVEFSDSFHPTSVVSTAYALTLATATPQPLCNQSVTHSFYLDGGYTPLWRCPTTAVPSTAYSCSLSPLFSISCALSCTFLHSQKTQLFHFQAIPHLLEKKRGGGYLSDPQVLAVFLEIQPGQSGQLSPLHGTPVTSHQSRVTKLGLK